MSGSRGASLGRLAGVGLAAVLLAAIGLASLLPSTREERAFSVQSVTDEGRRAVFVLLRRLGFRARAWTKAPGALPEGDHLLVLPFVPEQPPGYGDETGTPPIRRSSRLRDPQHYRRFVEQGGTILMAARGTERRDFLREELGIAELDELVVRGEEVAAHPRVLMASGDELEAHLAGGKRFGPLPIDSPFEVRVADEHGRPLVVELTLGRGALLLTASAVRIENAVLDEDDSALFFVRLLEQEGVSGEILFDEYALGGWVPDSPLELALAPENAGLTLHLVALCTVLLWGAAWVSSFPRDPEPLAQLAPLERARGVASLLGARGRWSLLGVLLQEGVLRRIAARSGVRGLRLATSAEEGGAADSPTGFDPGMVEEVLRPLGGALGGEQALQRALELFRPRRLADEAELDRLGEELRRLERRVAAGEREEED